MLNIAGNETGKPQRTLASPYRTRSMAVGNEPRNNQKRRFGTGVLERAPAPVKILMLAEVGGIVGRTGFVLAFHPVDELAVVGGSVNETGFVLVLDATNESAVVGSTVNQLFGCGVVVLAGRVAVGK